MALLRSTSYALYGGEELEHYFEVIRGVLRGDETLINARKFDSTLQKINTLDDFLVLCDNLDVVNALKYRTNPADASTEVDLPDNYKRILIAFPSYMDWLQTNYATHQFPVPFLEKASIPSYKEFLRETEGKEYLYDEIRARESEKFHMLGPYASTPPTATNGNTAGDNTGGSDTTFTKLVVDEPKLANREGYSEIAHHQVDNCPVVGSDDSTTDDLNRIISGFVSQQDTVLNRELAYRTQDSDLHKKPIKIFDIPLQVRSDPNVVNAFRWRKTEQAITPFACYFTMQHDGNTPPSSSFVCDHIATSLLQSFNLSIHPTLSVFPNGYNVLLRFIGLPVSIMQLDDTVVCSVPPEEMCRDDPTILSSSSSYGPMMTVNGETYYVGSHHKLDMQLFVHSAAEMFEEYIMLSLFVNTGDKASYDMSTDFTATATNGARRISDFIIVNRDEVKLFDEVLGYHLPAWSSCLLHYVAAASDVIMCTTPSYIIASKSFHDFVNIVLHLRNMHYLHYLQCAGHNDGGDSSSCAQLLPMILGHNLYRVGSVYFVCNCFASIDNVSAIYYGSNISLLRVVTKYGERFYILSHKQEDVCSAYVFVEFSDINLFDLSRSHEKKAFIITVQSHHSVLHQLCRLVCLRRNKVNEESSAMDSSLAYWSQFVSYTGVFIGDTITSWGANNGEASCVGYFSMPRENGELVSCFIKPKEYRQHNAWHDESTVCPIDTQHSLRREIALQIGFFMSIVCPVNMSTVNHSPVHSSLRKPSGCHYTTAHVHRSSCNSKSNRNMLQSDTARRDVLNQPYGASTRFLSCTDGDTSSTTPATREVTHVLSSSEFPGLLIRRYVEYDPETREVAITPHFIDGINDHLVSVHTDNSVLTHVTEGHIEEEKWGAHSWKEEWGEFICKEEFSLQVSLPRVALVPLVGCWSVTPCVPTCRDVVSYICKTLYGGRHNDFAVDSAVNTMAPTTYEMLCDVSCPEVKAYVGAKSFDLSCERFLCYDLSDFLEILCNRADMLMSRYIMNYMKFLLGKRRSYTLGTDLDKSFGNVLHVLHLAFTYGRLYYPARITSQRCIYSTASSSKVLLQSTTLIVGNNISSTFYGTTLPYWRVRKLLQALACWFTTICNTTTIMLNYGEHIIAASIGYVIVVYDLLLAMFKFILNYRNNRFDLTRIDRWGVSHNSEFGFEYVGTDRYGMLTYLYVRL